MPIPRLCYVFANVELSISHRSLRNRGLWNTAVCIPVHCSRDRWSKSPRTRQVVGMSGMSTDTSRQHLPTLAVSHTFALRSYTRRYLRLASLLFMACRQESTPGAIYTFIFALRYDIMAKACFCRDITAMLRESW